MILDLLIGFENGFEIGFADFGCYGCDVGF